jgi:transcriptional regulator with XRE-family HTH domain
VIQSRKGSVLQDVSPVTLADVGRRKADDGVFLVTPRGARLLKEAQERADPRITVAALGEIAGVSKGVMSEILNGKQPTCRNLRSVCARLGVNFWATQNLTAGQARLLEDLDRLAPRGASAVEVALELFATHVAGVLSKPPSPNLNGDTHDAEPRSRRRIG